MKFERLTAFLMAIAFASGSSAGAEIYKVSVDDKGSGEFSGSFPGTTGGKAAFEILKPGKNVNDEDAFIYAGETNIDGTGGFADIFNISGPSGRYMLRLGFNGSVLEKKFMFVNEQEMSDYLLRIKSAQSAEEIGDIFEENYGRLKFLCGINILPADKDEVYKALYDRLKSEEVESFSKIKEIVAEVVLINDFLKAKENKANALEKLFDYFDSKYTPVIGLWKNNSIASDTIKNSVISYLQSKEIFSMKEMEAEFCESALFTMLSKVNSRGKELTVVTEAHDLIGMAEYDRFSTYPETKKINILSNIKSGYTNTSEYAQRFDNAVKTYKDPVNTPSGGSTGGGGVIIDTTPSTPGPEPTIAPKPTETDGFTDIDDFEWARSNIERLFEKKIINGKGDGIFAPADHVTREEFVAMIINALSMRNNSAVCDLFTDVGASDWFYIPIASAVEKGIITGIEQNLFGVGRNITRQDAAAIVERAAKAAGIYFSDDSAPPENQNTAYEYAVIKKDAFYDSDQVSDYAKQAVERVHSMGIINGYPDGEFKPDGTMNRAEAAVITDKLMKFLDAQKDAASDKDKAYISELKAIGMYSGDDTMLSENITRAEAAKTICGLMNIKNPGVRESRFSDVSAEDENSGYIYELSERHILDGTDGKFYSDRELDYNDAVKAAVMAMGYVKAAEQGGYPDGYLKVAAENKYLDGVTSSDGKITKLNLLRLFGNLIDKEVMGYTPTEKEYSKDTATYLEVYFGIKNAKGQVTANSFTGIGSDSEVGKGNIKIDGIIMKNPDSEYEKLIGSRVEYFYKETGSDEYELVFAKRNNRTTVTTVKASDIESFSDMTYRYRAEGSHSYNKKIKISKNTNIVLNNQRIFDYSDAELLPESGEIEFIDFDGNGVFDENDTVKITSYTNIVVNSVDASRQIIFDKYTDYSNPDSEDYSINLQNINEYKIHDKYGDEYGLNELREWDVLAVMQTPDKDYAEITLVDECAGGKLESIGSTDDGETCLKIGGKQYPVSENFRGDLSKFICGNDVTVYWDLYGKVTAIENGIASYAEKNESTASQQNELTDKLVIVSGYAMDKEENEVCYLKTYYSDKKITTFPLVEKVKINEKRYKSLEAETELDDMLGKVVKIRLNDKNEIDEIVTAAAPGEDDNRGLWLLNYPNENLRYGSEASNFGARFFKKNSIVYTIPKTASEYTNSDAYSVNTAQFSNDSVYQIDGYTTDLSSKSAEVIVYKADPVKGGQISEGSAFIIGDIANTVNADGESVLTLEGIDYNNGKNGTSQVRSYELSKDVMFIDFYGKEITSLTVDDLEPGDCLRYGENNGVIETIQLTYDYSKSELIYNDGTKSNRAYAGDAYDVSADGAYLTIATGKRAWEIDEKAAEAANNLASYWIRSNNMYTIVDKTGTKTVVKKGSNADIQTYKKAGKSCSRVVLFSEWASTIYAVVVYIE